MKIKNFIIVIIGIILVITMKLLSPNEGNARPPDNKVSTPVDTIPIDTIPLFYSQTPQEGLWEALLYYDIHHPEIVYGQALLETGHFKSKGCTRDNNLFGLYNSRKGEYHKFNHWTESVEAYKTWIQYRYNPTNNYYEFLQRIRYAGDPEYTIKLKQIVRKHGKVKQDSSTSYNQQTRSRVQQP